MLLCGFASRWAYKYYRRRNFFSAFIDDSQNENNGPIEEGIEPVNPTGKKTCLDGAN